MKQNQLEFRILSLLRDREAYLKYARLIKDKMFESRENRLIYKLIQFYHRNDKAKPVAPISSLFALLSSRVKENEEPKYRIAIRKVKKHPLRDLSIGDTVVKNFCKVQLLKMHVLGIVSDLDHINPDRDLSLEKFRSQLDEALLLDSADLLEEGYDYLTNPLQRIQQDKDTPRVSTGIKELDSNIRGGMAAGDLGVIIAPLKVGKTMMMINFGYAAMRHGKKVVYVTLELSSRRISGRFDQRITGKHWQVLENNPSIIYKSIRKLKKLGGGLRIKDSTASRLSVNELGIYLNRIRKEFNFDIVFIDQLALMYSPKEYKERRQELSSIAIGLRRLGSNLGVPIWVAHQAGRKAGEDGTTTVWDISEDIGVAQWADVVLALSQSPEDKEENVMFLDVAANRISEGNAHILLKTNYTKMKVTTGEIEKEKGD